MVPFYDYYERTMHNLERFARESVIDERMKTPVDETYQRMVEKLGAEAINTAEK